MVLIQFAVMAIVYSFAFGYKKITPSAAPAITARNNHNARKNYIFMDTSNPNRKNLAFLDFMIDIFRLSDIVGMLDLKEGAQNPLIVNDEPADDEFDANIA